MIKAIEGPARTCVGCRKSDSITELFRVVLEVHEATLQAESLHAEIVQTLVVDHRLQKPGRGAWLHLSTKCLDLAEKKRAFSRALRTQGEIQTTDVSEFAASGFGQVGKI